MTSTIFSWSISHLEREASDDFVCMAHFTLEAFDGTYSSGIYEAVSFKRPETLIPFLTLKETDIVEWIQDELGQERIAELKAKLQNSLDEQQQPSKIAGVPWVNAEVL